MPAPKMILNNVSLNQPAYGAYRAYIHTGIKWSFVGDNWKGYDIGAKYLRSEFSVQLDETQINNLMFDYSQEINLELSTGHGFYPFSPLLAPIDMVYPCYLTKHNYSGVLKSPWKYTECKMELLLNDPELLGELSFLSESVVLNEGTTAFYNPYGIDDLYLRGIREIDQPPDLSLPDFYNVAITQTGRYQPITNKIPSYENAGVVSEVNITGSYSKVNKILLYLLTIGRDWFYICMPDNYYTSEPVGDTMEPDYWIFGRKEPMKKYIRSAPDTRWFYGWKVRCISNPIQVSHDNLRHFTVTLKLALQS